VRAQTPLVMAEISSAGPSIRTSIALPTCAFVLFCLNSFFLISVVFDFVRV
jgi:hypothetical protein